VIQDETGIGIGRNLRELRVKGEPARIIDDLGSVFDGFTRHLGFIRIHRDGHHQFALQPLQYGNQTPQLFCFGDAGSSGSSGFRADIDNIDAFLLHFDGARERAIRVSIVVAVGERVRRDVEHADDKRTVAKLQRLLGQFPFVAFSAHYSYRKHTIGSRFAARFAG
jgi:hypothetical protein